jgi:hypothetical protein
MLDVSPSWIGGDITNPRSPGMPPDLEEALLECLKADAMVYCRWCHMPIWGPRNWLGTMVLSHMEICDVREQALDGTDY